MMARERHSRSKQGLRGTMTEAVALPSTHTHRHPHGSSRKITSSVAREVDALFKRNNIGAVKEAMKKKRLAIDNMKDEMRTMVGERYRDILDAADTIRLMQTTAQDICRSFSLMEEYCNLEGVRMPNEGIKEGEGMMTKETVIDDNLGQLEKGGSSIEPRTGKTGKNTYVVAAQIKLLVDTPNQIWKSLEHHQFLTAARLYVIAKQIYQNLKTGPASTTTGVSTTNVMESFPVVQKQWDAVHHFRQQIVDKCMSFFDKVELSTLGGVEAICAIILMEKCHVEKALSTFLDRRASFIQSLLGHEESVLTKDGTVFMQNLQEQVRRVIVALRCTITVVYSIFTPIRTSSKGFKGENSEEKVQPSLLEAYMTALERGPAIDSSVDVTGAIILASSTTTKPTSQPRAVLHALYASKTNLRTLFRYLPSNIQHYRPILYIPMDPNRASMDNGGSSDHSPALPIERLADACTTWMGRTTALIRTGLDAQLNVSVDISTTSLAQLRVFCFGLLHQDQMSLIQEQSLNERDGIVPATQYLQSTWDTPEYDHEIGENVLDNFTVPWSKISVTLLGKPVSLWHDILREAIMQRCSKNIKDRFQRVLLEKDDASVESSEKTLLLRAYLYDDLNDNVGDGTVNESTMDIGAMLWNHRGSGTSFAEDDGTDVNILKNDVILSSRLTRVCNDVMQAVKEVSHEVSQFMPTQPSLNNPNSDVSFHLFDVYKDGQEMVGLVEKAFFELLAAYKDVLLNHLDLLSTEYEANTISTTDAMSTKTSVSSSDLLIGRRRYVDKAICIGRLARVISQHARTYLHTMDTLKDAANFSINTNTSQTLLMRRTSLTDIDTMRVRHAMKAMVPVYNEAFKLWIKYVTDILSDRFAHGFKTYPWNLPYTFTQTWEGISEELEDGADASLYLPVLASSYIMDYLNCFSGQIHRVAGQALEKPILQQTMSKSAERIFGIILEMLPLSDHENVPDGSTTLPCLNDKAALQLLFDVKFLALVYRQAWPLATLGQLPYLSVYDSCCQRLRSFIDPIDLVLIDAHLPLNVEAFLSRTNVLLGLLLPHRKAGDTSKRAKVSTKYQAASYNFMPLAKCTTRFSRLPISQAMISDGIYDNADSPKTTARRLKVRMEQETKLELDATEPMKEKGQAAATRTATSMRPTSTASTAVHALSEALLTGSNSFLQPLSTRVNSAMRTSGSSSGTNVDGMSGWSGAATNFLSGVFSQASVSSLRDETMDTRMSANSSSKGNNRK